MSKTATLRLPRSPGNRKPVATQYAPAGQSREAFIKIYKYGDTYYAYADDGVYVVPSPVIDVLVLSPAAEDWLYNEAVMEADRVHYSSSLPSPAAASRHFLLAGLVARGTLDFDAAWDMFREALEGAGPDVDPDVAPTTWHKAFAEQWFAIKAELEARS